jgi:hypothetical protein
MTRPSLAIPLLVATAALAGAPAFAQQPAPAPTAQAPAAPAAPAAPVAQAPAGTPAPAADATAPAAAPPAQVAEAPAPPPPVLPTTGDGAAITTILTKICVPLANGGDFKTLIKAAGLKQDSKTQEWVQPLAQKPFQISIADPGANNKGTCEITVRYAPGWDQPIIDALNIWRFLQSPQLHLQRSDKMNTPTVQRVSTTWDNYENQLIDSKMVGLILVQLNKPDGTAALTPTYDEAIIQYQVRKAVMAEGVVDPAALAAQEAAAKAAAAKEAADKAAAAAQQSAQAPAAAAAPATPPAT